MAEYTRDDELDLSDIVAAARLAGMIPGTGRFSRAILGAGYRRTEPPSPDWELRDQPTGPVTPGHPPACSCGECGFRRASGITGSAPNPAPENEHAEARGAAPEDTDGEGWDEVRP